MVEQCHRLDNLMFEMGALADDDPPIKERVDVRISSLASLSFAVWLTYVLVQVFMNNMHETIAKIEECDIACDTLSRPSPYKFTPVWAPHEVCTRRYRSRSIVVCRSLITIYFSCLMSWAPLA